jgi:hypothetical protein
MMEAIQHLRHKGHEITDEEAEGVTAAILLATTWGMDRFPNGTGTRAHSRSLHPKPSPAPNLWERMNRHFNWRPGRCHPYFQATCTPNAFSTSWYPANLDMDRLDYLRRDSFLIRCHRGQHWFGPIIKMLNVVQRQTGGGG